ncbi:MAG TPA: hypothetical protein VMB48_06245 [Steroidobacteraceae bacterium]|nr:hypothetical protein [Steroidobacteraceae bacterium]
MTERAAAEEALRIGALLDAAERQQRAVQEAVSHLAAQADALDSVLREQVREVLLSEFRALGDAGQTAARALEGVRRAAGMRLALWSIAVAVCSAAVPLAVGRLLLPTPEELGRLRRESASLAATVAQLRAQGGGIDLRRCGSPPRLCVRVDRSAPSFGRQGDYLVVKGE